MLIEDFIPHAGIVLVASAPYVGKTFFALEAARAVEFGGKFLGKYRAEPGRVLVVEQDSPVWDLAQQYDKLIGFPPKQPVGDPDDGLLEHVEDDAEEGAIRFVFEHTRLQTAEQIDQLAGFANADTQYLGYDFENDVPIERQGFDLIVIDTLRSVHDLDENDNKVMQHMMAMMRRLSRKTNAAILVLHHFNKASWSDNRGHNSYEPDLDRVRGGSALPGAVDGIFALTRVNGETGAIKLTVLKNRAAPEMRGFEYYQTTGACTGKVTLGVESSMPGTAAFRRSTVLGRLEHAKGTWVQSSALRDGLILAEGKNGEVDSVRETYAARVRDALGELVREKLVERQTGKARLIVRESKAALASDSAQTSTLPQTGFCSGSDE
jgi:hypothetical protein